MVLANKQGDTLWTTTFDVMPGSTPNNVFENGNIYANSHGQFVTGGVNVHKK